MRRRTFLSLVVAAALLFTPASAADRRIVAVADAHGAGAAFISVLQRAGLINARRHWSGGHAVLVQTGDIMDRGPDVRMLLDFLVTLEREASAAGGRVERLLGNHEFMAMTGHTRDATPEIYASWADGQSDARQERAFTDAQQLAGGTLDKAAWMAAHPRGYVEYREAFAPDGMYGKYLRTKPVAVKIDSTIFMHAGIAPELGLSLDEVNARAKADLQAWDTGVRWVLERKLILPFSTLQEIVAAADTVAKEIVARKDAGKLQSDDAKTAQVLQPVLTITQSSLFAGNGPMWFRGYARWTDEQGAPLMAALLKQYDVKRFVVGHTPVEDATIRERFNGGVYLIDTGMLGPPNFPGGRPSALEIVGDKVTPMYVEGGTTSR
jgi:hypothetical protein